ncbi:SDR family oxidoreductase (plasmid) [Rhodococcus opacus]|uniref:SDR family NAD(P)-dependent oxidoreductase n=1 Tax=Rhodococcus opacus TaxID=37919 RepID=A0AAX3YSS5_RHOOP|nr:MULTISPECIES: SDR family oxidoreductase [Rhodococcus]MCZ4590089.1 SDR family NAD(P)-dependent oxidoreductase [Rhodococcus opacus]MDI9941270.1 SDR family oxidoreductase [Rhodococcus sp. IEGM 1351]WKN61164.1 SDR family oxidoreductase [Rhodococcus opacus]WLF51676.1 SDR family oxidoreductase [Rhodococcus opacus]WLF52527.1 SDR family oxidoreductase [Rhodococcus opacus]
MTEQVVLVTGSSGGIGAAIVDALVNRGDVVVGADRTPRNDQNLASFLNLDVTDEKQSKDAVHTVIGRHGRIDALIHTAGVLGETADPLTTTTEEFERIMRINATGTFTIARETANAMRSAGTAGTILLFSSVAAKEARIDYLPYNASKIAVLHIMWSMAKILGPSGISVNAVSPGPVNTEMWTQLAAQSGSAQAARNARARELPMQRFAEPDEVARTVAFLTASENRYLTGLSVDVAGGAHLGMGT